MASRVEQFEITTPAGTLQAAPITTALVFLEGTVQRMELTIPGGHAGLTGIALFHSSIQVIPFQAGTFIRGDDQDMKWDLARYPTGAKWSVRTFNTDVFAHTHHLRLLIEDIPTAPLAPAVEAQPIQPEATEEELAAEEELPTELPDLAELADLAETT